MNTSLIPYVGAYIGGQLAGITLVAIVAKKVMQPKPTAAYAPSPLRMPADELKKFHALIVD